MEKETPDGICHVDMVMCPKNLGYIHHFLILIWLFKCIFKMILESMATIKCYSPFPIQEIVRSSIRNGEMRVTRAKTANLWESKGRTANLSARKKEKIKLPNHSGDSEIGIYHISKFVNHPSGVEAILNTRALQSCHTLDSNLYRCILPEVRLLNFEVAPVIDLQVTSTSEDCVVEMLTCKFEGSDAVERQNEHFSASMKNHIRWGSIGNEPFLEVDVRLNLVLEIYTQPFTMLPTSAVEGPGTVMIQAMVDKLVPLLMKQLVQDYEDWVCRQRKIDSYLDVYPRAL